MNEKIEYSRLLKIARKMSLWIFHHTCCEDEVYFNELGLTEEEADILGYGGTMVIVGKKEEE